MNASQTTQTTLTNEQLDALLTSKDSQNLHNLQLQNPNDLQLQNLHSERSEGSPYLHREQSDVHNLTLTTDPELSSLRSVLADLRSTSEEVARQHFIQASINAKPATRFSFTLRAWSTLATAALLLGVFTPHLIHRTPPPPAQPVTIAQQEPAPAISDEALLASVQDDLDASVPSAMLPLATSTSTTKSNTQRKQK